MDFQWAGMGYDSQELILKLSFAQFSFCRKAVLSVGATAFFFESCPMTALVILFAAGHGAQGCTFSLSCSPLGFLLTPWMESHGLGCAMTGRKGRLLFGCLSTTPHPGLLMLSSSAALSL